MSRGVPKYRRHPNGSAFVSHKSIPNRTHRLYLGKYGSPESKAKYAEFLAQIAAGGDPLPPVRVGSHPSVNALIAAYLDYAVTYYQREHGLSPEYDLMVYALRPLATLFGSQPAALFGPQKLVKVRTHLAAQGLARTNVNHLLSRIKKFWRWACENEHVPPELHYKLLCVRGLAKGQDGCREAAPVRPATEASIVGVLPFLSPTIATMIQVQYRCGMRPGEVCIMRACDIDASGSVWLYRPNRHKTEHLDYQQVKAIPSIVQPLLRPLLSMPAYLFPVRQKCKRQLAVPAPYPTSAYRKAVRRGFARASKAGFALTPFSPNQLRHAIGTQVSQLLGQQASQRYLGHENLNTTNIYTERQIRELVEVAQALDARWQTSA